MLNTQLNNMHDLLEQGVYSLKIFIKRSNLVKNKIEESYHTLKSPEDKTKLLKEVLQKVDYTKKINSRWHSEPDDFELVLYPKLNK